MTTTREVDIAAILENRKLSRYNFIVIAVSTLITFLDGFDLLMLAHTASYIGDEISLTKIQIGEIFSIGLIGMMVGGFFFGYLGDRIGRRPTIIISTFAFAILTMAFTLADSYNSLMVLRFLNGFALGAMLPLCWALNIEFVPRRYRATVVTIIMVGFSLGSAMAGPITVWMAPFAGWRGVFILGGALSLAAAVLLLFTLPESVRFLASKKQDPARIAALLRRLGHPIEVEPGMRFVLQDEGQVKQENFRISQLFAGRLKWITPTIWLGYSASSMAMYFLASWSPLVYTYAGFDRATASWVSSIASFTGAMAGLLMMRFVDLKGPYTVMIYPLLALPFLVILGTTGMQGTGFIVLSLIGAVFVKGSHYGIQSIAGVFYPSAIRANGAGWATSIAKIGSIFGPLIGAYMLDSGLPIVKSFLVLAICPAVLALCAWIIGNLTSGQRQEPVRTGPALNAGAQLSRQ